MEKSGGPLYWYGPEGKLLAESDTSGNIITEYLYFGSTRIGRRDPSTGNIYYFLSDQLGSTADTCVTVTANQDPVDLGSSSITVYDYDEFGGTTVLLSGGAAGDGGMGCNPSLPSKSYQACIQQKAQAAQAAACSCTVQLAGSSPDTSQSPAAQTLTDTGSGDTSISITGPSTAVTSSAATAVTTSTTSVFVNLGPCPPSSPANGLNPLPPSTPCAPVAPSQLLTPQQVQCSAAALVASGLGASAAVNWAGAVLTSEIPLVSAVFSVMSGVEAVGSGVLAVYAAYVCYQQ